MIEIVLYSALELRTLKTRCVTVMLVV